MSGLLRFLRLTSVKQGLFGFFVNFMPDSKGGRHNKTKGW